MVVLTVSSLPAQDKSGLEQWDAARKGLASNPDVIAWYDFQDGQGQTLTNKAKGSGVAAGVIKGATWTEGRWPGKKALLFNGKSDYVTIPSSPALCPFGQGGANEMSIEIWLNAANPQEAGVIDKSSGGGYASPYVIWISPTRLTAFIWDRKTVNKLHDPGELETGKWTHLVLTVAAGSMKLYKNGVACAEVVRTVTPADNNAPLLIGWMNTPGRWFFDGVMDEVVIYRKALSPDAIKSLSMLRPTAPQVKTMKMDWIKVTDKAGWQPRDSQGEVVFKDKMWIFGGWFSSNEPCPRDVWNTADGKTWTRVKDVAPWKHSDLPMTVVYKDKIWFMGGWYNGRLPDHSASGEMWSSSDGINWEQATQNAGWSPRVAAGVVVFKDKMWILGGIVDYLFGDDNSLRNDVWNSQDGKEWTRVTEHAGWSPRAFHQAVVFDGKIWVMGGGNYSPKHHALNDVWCSEDGINWTQVTKSAAWNPRIWFSCVVYRDRMWIMGGYSAKKGGLNDPNGNFNDVWYSRDGKDWQQLVSDVRWHPRHELSAFVFQDRIWVTAGYSPLNSEVWSLSIPEGWLGK